MKKAKAVNAVGNLTFRLTGRNVFAKAALDRSGCIGC